MEWVIALLAIIAFVLLAANWRSTVSGVITVWTIIDRLAWVALVCFGIYFLLYWAGFVK